MADIKVASDKSAVTKADGKKPYVKPALRPLGTVRELTLNHTSGNTK
jgi:hypothetical protein